jgi:hypothetical protein
MARARRDYLERMLEKPPTLSQDEGPFVSDRFAWPMRIAARAAAVEFNEDP